MKWAALTKAITRLGLFMDVSRDLALCYRNFS
jgi:hypothetical protein